MKALQFGSTGQVARELVRRSRAGGVELKTLSRADVDLQDTAAISAAVAGADVDVVINAAAYTAVDLAEVEEPLAMAINAQAPAAMAVACQARGLPFIHLSTDYVFDGEKSGGWIESDQTRPLNAYGRSKLAGEQAVLGHMNRAVVLRTSWVFSAHGSNFVKTMLRLGGSRDELLVIDDQMGCPTFAGDIAQAIILASHRAAGILSGNEVYHFASPNPCSWHTFAEAIFSLSPDLKPKVTPIPSTDYPTAARRPHNSVLDTSRFTRTFGLAPRCWSYGLQEAMFDMQTQDLKR